MLPSPTPFFPRRESHLEHPFTLTLAGLLLLAGASACAPVMEADRPTPTDLSQFAVGETRPQIINVIGAPAAQKQDGIQSCDIYKLYTKGPNNVGKVAIVTTEVTADIFTLGLAEVITSPVEYGTRNKKHTVTFCYATDGKLITMTDGGVSK
jgi:hypothetical protein